MFKIYILDNANQLIEESYTTQEQADDAADRWEDLAANVYESKDKAIAAHDRFTRLFFKNVSFPSIK